MSNQTISVELTERTIVRKGLNSLRREGLVPAVVHDHGKKSMHVSGDYRSIAKAYEAAGKHHPVQVHIGSKEHMALIKDVDFHPVKRTVRHVVFQAINVNEKAHTVVPIELVGDIPAKKLSLIVLTHLDEVEVTALPKDLPDVLKVDATTLENEGDRLTVADIKAPSGVTIDTDSEHVIATVEVPKDQLADANAAAAEMAAASDVPAEETPADEAKTDA